MEDGEGRKGESSREWLRVQWKELEMMEGGRKNDRKEGKERVREDE